MKKALVVGVTKYQYMIANPALWGRQSGDMYWPSAESDAQKMKKLLEQQLGFAAAGITLLLNEAATADSLRSKLLQLIQQAGAGDTVVFYFAGHGANLFHNPLEDDVRDEVLCLHDMDWDAGKSGYFRDNELDDLAAMLAPDAHLEVILECCAAGGMYDNNGLIYRLLLALRLLLRGFSRWFMGWAFSSRFYRFPVQRAARHVVWAACAENQGSNTDASNSYGLFTKSFDQRVRETAGVVTRAALLQWIKNDVAGQRTLYNNNRGPNDPKMAEQTPELDCAAAAYGRNLLSF